MALTLDPLFAALLDVEGAWRLGDDETLDDVVELWVGLTHAHRVLGDFVKLVADDAAVRLADRDDPRADYETATGDVVHLGAGYTPERWKGRQVVQALAERVHDGEGEVFDAVAVEVLLDVLPGCADDDATSSKWRTTGLRRQLGEDGWRRYRSRDTAPQVIKRGPRPT